MDSYSKHLQRLETPAESRLFDHLLLQAKTLHPNDAIHAFRQLLIEGKDYSNSLIQADFDWILQANFIQADFRFILNRSCYIFINAWFNTVGYRVYIPELIDTFESIPLSTPTTPREQKLWHLLKLFVCSPQYKALQCLAVAIRSDLSRTSEYSRNPSLETTVNRYPYIYRHRLLTRDSSFDQRQMIRKMQRDAQRQFDVSLSRYRAYQRFNQVPSEKRTENNPTLLAPKNLNYALHQFSGKIDGKNTQRDLAQQFLTYSQWTRSYRDFKRDLYRYLAIAIQDQFGKHHFNRRLASYLNETLESFDSSVPNQALVSETCKKLLNFLVVESSQHPDHANFIDLIGNIGATLTMTLLLKVVLLCQQAKPWLERRLSILFNHYANQPKSDVIWLVEALENANVAFSTNFGLTFQNYPSF